MFVLIGALLLLSAIIMRGLLRIVGSCIGLLEGLDCEGASIASLKAKIGRSLKYGGIYW
jgi:hypothetical protein